MSCKHVMKHRIQNLQINHPEIYLGILIGPILQQIFIFYFAKQLVDTIISMTVVEMISIPLIYFINFIIVLLHVAHIKTIRHNVKIIIYKLYFHLIASYGLFMAGSLVLIGNFNPKYPILLYLFSENVLPEGIYKVLLLIYSIFLLISLLFTFQFGYNHFVYEIEKPVN